MYDLSVSNITLDSKPIQDSPTYQVTPDGRVFNVSGYLMKSYSVSGYRAIKLCLSPDSPRTTYLIHRLVYEAHVGPIPEGYHVRHKDGQKANNTLENLELVSTGDEFLEVEEFKVAVRTLSDQGFAPHYLAKAFNISELLIKGVLV